MDKLKNPLIVLAVMTAFIGLSLLSGALTPRLSPTVAAETDKAPRKFYLTTTGYNGAQATSACASGYHMASLWEIYDPSSVRYDRQLGFNWDSGSVFDSDMGFGPPSQILGWIRTGYFNTIQGPAGFVNCDAYRSSDATHFGTQVKLP